ncbi:hypothetical protein BDR22DRAFT_961508 [Usnea florida]
MSAGNSGFASLRAKFEQKDESTSPPSRGRSPAASLSVAGDDSRPISKVRTSFVSVEDSGQMGDSNTSEDLGSKGVAVNGDGTEEHTTNGAVEESKTNGINSTPQKSHKMEESTPKQSMPNISPQKPNNTPHKNLGIANGITSTANPDKPSSAAEDDTAVMLPSDPKDATVVSGGAALEGDSSPLGSILKGSPFEQDEKTAAAEPIQSSGQQAKSPSTPLTNGKSKEAQARKPGQQSKTENAPRLSNVGKKPSAPPVSSTAEKSKSKPQTSPLPAPMTPKDTATPTKKPLSTKMSPKLPASKQPKKEILEDTRKMSAERPSRPSAPPKAPVPVSKLAQKPGKKPGPTSPQSFTKPRPKSPTRPIRLPGSATAPTAASAAKVDAAPPATRGKSGDRVPSNPMSSRHKPIRASLPGGSKPVEKTKEKPNSRLSTASSKAPEGSFLDRMMRPTQSSSQKTHEKVEAKSPPRKTSGVRPKRKSDVSEKARSENVETTGEQSTETVPSAPAQDPAGSSEAPTTNGANIVTEEAASASAA